MNPHDSISPTEHTPPQEQHGPPHEHFQPHDADRAPQPQMPHSPPATQNVHSHQPTHMFGPQPSVAPSVAADETPRPPIPVVKVLSPLGVEYVFMTFSLFVTATSIVGVLLSFVNGGTDFSTLAFPTATLVVALPVFAIIFLHLKRLELQTPSLRLDPSKRRSTQVTQIVSFLVSFFTLIGFAYAVMASVGGLTTVSVGKAALDALSVLAVSLGVLAYYWRDEHKVRR